MFGDTMRSSKRGFVAAVIVVVAAAVLRAAIGKLGVRIPFVTFYPAVMIAGIYGGMRAGLLATALSAFLSTFWMEPVGSPWVTHVEDWIILTIFISTCILLSYSSKVMYRALARAKEAEAKTALACEREKAAVAIQKGEERFRILADNIAQLAWMADENGRIFWFNKRWYDFTGTTLEEMEGLGWKKVHHPEHVDRVFDRIQKSWDTGEPWEDTFPLRGKDGRYRWFLSRALPIRDESGGITRWFGTNTDITDQLEAEAKLRESREKYRRLVNLIPAAIFSCDADGEITFFNKRAVELWGREPNMPTDRYCGSWRIYRPSGSLLPHNECPMAIAVTQAKPFRNEEIVIERPNGSRVIASVNIDPFVDESGDVAGAVNILMDVTERKRIEEELRKNEEKLRLALDAAQMGTWDWNIVTGEMVWSERCRSFFAFAPEDELSYVKFLNSVHLDDRDRVELAVRESIEKRTVYQTEMRVVWPDGSLHWFLAKGRTFYDSSGKPARMSGIGMDITTRKQIEEELRTAKDEAEKRARELEALMDAVPALTWISRNPDCRFMSGSRATYELLKMPFRANLSKTAEDAANWPAYLRRTINHTEIIPPKELPMQLAASGQEVRDYEMEVAFENGESRVIFGNANPLIDDSGNPYGAVGAFVDITERKRLEEALEKRIVALTRPLDTTEGIAFEDLFNLEEIQEVQDRFAKACGVASIITRIDGTPITKPSNFCQLCRDIIRKTKKGRENCHCSDAVIGRHNVSGPNIQPCLSGGLWDAGASISVGGRHIANWLVGQVRNETQSESKMRRYAREIGADEEKLVEAFREVPSMPLDQFEKVAQALFTLAGELSSMAYQNVQQARFIRERELMEKELRAARDELELRVKERTAELEKANKILRDQADLIDLAHDAIFVRDMNSAVTFWNKGATETYGFTLEKALGKVTHDLLRTKFPQPLDMIMEKFFKHKRWEGELRHTTSTGKEIVAESRWALKSDESGNPESILEINRDVTGRKKAEEMLKANLARLELINSELQEFAFVAAHDLQEPLRKIMTFGDLLKTRYSTALDESGVIYLERIINSVARMRDQLYDLMEYSRVATRPEPRKQADLGKIAREVLKSFEEKIRETGAGIEIGTLPIMEVGEHQISRLFQNLIGNALKFRSEAPPVIKIDSDCRNGEYCEIFVRDNGIGFEQEYAELIFKPFQRLHGRGEYEGTGMGLAICRKIAERHGGSIRAESKPGRGSKFIVKLPVKQ